MHSNWQQYEVSGTNTYYMVCNVILMVVPFPLYVLALAVLFQRQTSRNLRKSSTGLLQRSYIFSRTPLEILSRSDLDFFVCCSAASTEHRDPTAGPVYHQHDPFRRRTGLHHAVLETRQMDELGRDGRVCH